jgi:hypothetical protein
MTRKNPHPIAQLIHARALQHSEHLPLKVSRPCELCPPLHRLSRGGSKS